MVLMKEYRTCMPLTVEEYKIGQLYMIAKHSNEESQSGDGVEVIANNPCEDPIHGKGQYTEKKIHLSSRLPEWLQAVCPRVFYVIEKSWNFYPYTVTEYSCSFIPRFQITIKTRFEDNNGNSENAVGLSEEELAQRTIDFIDIAYDEVDLRKYKEQEDPRYFQSKETNRGPLMEGWMETTTPIMCSYKFVQVNFEVWGLQTRVEDTIQRTIRDILLLGHRQAFAWIDEWYGMTLEDVRAFEEKMQKKTNEKVVMEAVTSAPDVGGLESPKSPTSRGWLSWS